MTKIESNLQTALDCYREGDLEAALEYSEAAATDIKDFLDHRNEKD